MFLSKRCGIYYLWYDDATGRRQKVSTRSRTKSDALQFLQSFRQVPTATEPSEIHSPRKMISELFREYQEHSKTIHTHHTQRTYRDGMQEFQRIIGDLDVSKVGVKQIEQFLAVKQMESSSWTARKYHIVIASVFESARRWGYISSNPCRQVRRATMAEVQPVFFSLDEFKQLYDLIEDPDFRDLVLCAFATGMRLGEITSLRWPQIEFGRKLITVQNSAEFTTKSKKNRAIPMNERVFEMLSRRHGNRSGDYVFHSAGRKLLDDRVSKQFKKYVIKSGLNPRLHFHSLRHSFCSVLVQSGASLYEVQKLAGHSSPSVTQIYSHLLPEQLHGTVNRIKIDLE